MALKLTFTSANNLYTLNKRKNEKETKKYTHTYE